MEVYNVCPACHKEVDTDNCVIVVVGGVAGALHPHCYIDLVLVEMVNHASLMSCQAANNIPS